MIQEMEKRICQIGSEMVECRESCEDVFYDIKSGVPPRCLIFEKCSEATNDGIIIIGESPGPIHEEQQKYFVNQYRVSQCITYEDELTDWVERVYIYDHYQLIRGMINQLGSRLNILWTDLIKCQKKDTRQSFSKETVKKCALKFLARELDATPASWPIIALGRVTHDPLIKKSMLLGLCKNRSVIGIYHPTPRSNYFEMAYFNLKLDSRCTLDLNNMIRDNEKNKIFYRGNKH